ncbi:wax ester/triacylglycerol synthase domain-containing protein [Amycolatopsis sp. NPDC049868]|uniref:wax ester/triacylglycerol synthase domain-containing protein n=1 Tax=Amycolatopsis sp. NPDC049868 TaxID=3363934 RepID=UPI0037AC63F0
MVRMHVGFEKATVTDFWTRHFAGIDRIIEDPTDVYFGFVLRMRGEAPSLTSLREQVARAVVGIPMLTRRLVDSGGDPTWENEPQFDIDHHVWENRQLAPGVHPARTLFLNRPDPARPRWGICLLSGDDREWAVCYLVHHAVQDAVAALETMRRLFDGRTSGKAVLRGRRALGVEASVRLAPDVLSTYRAVTPWTPLLAPPLSSRTAAFAAVEQEWIEAIARATDATINQVHLAALTGALRDWSPGDWTGRLSRAQRRGLPVVMPVDTRKPGEDDLGNQFGLFRAMLPCGETDPERRLRSIMTATGRRRIDRYRRAHRTLVEAAPDVGDWLWRRIARTSMMVASSVQARDTLTVCGTPVAEIEAIPWLPPGYPCFSFLVSYKGRVGMSVLTHGGAPSSEMLVARWRDAIYELHSRLVETSRRPTAGAWRPRAF